MIDHCRRNIWYNSMNYTINIILNDIPYVIILKCKLYVKLYIFIKMYVNLN